MKVGPNLSLALAIGGGLVGLVLLHAFMHDQSAAASAITVGATLSSPFALIGDTSGSLVNSAAVSDAANAAGVSSAQSGGGTGSSGGYTGWTTQLYPAAPAGVPSEGWGAAMIGMHDIAAGTSPAIAGGYV